MLHWTGFHFCPRCGSREIVDHEQKALRCTRCDYRYYHNAAAAAAVILETPRGILLTRRRMDPHAGWLDLPGGFVDYEESFESAVIREIQEELHLNLAGLRYFGSFPNHYLFGGTTYFTADVVFVCKLQDLSTLRYNEEIEEVLFFGKDRIPFDQVGFPSMRQALEAYSRS
jgi:NADH pyrophosphatase NudC (nudix superfamily)